MKYDRTTRWIHAALALFIVAQLLLSLVMRAPNPDKIVTPLEINIFKFHRWAGVVVLTLLFLHWAWSLSGHVPNGLGHLFPWASKSRIKKVFEDMQPLLKFKLGDLPKTSALAGAVHGLGLLVSSLMALTGIILFFGISPEGKMTSPVRLVMEGHKYFSTFMWIYLAGHIVMGTLHQYIGHRTLSEMFGLIQK
jgi:cytochrome b561